MKIAVCDDDKLLTGEIDRQLQGLRQRMGISFETEIFFDGTTLWDSIERNGSYDIIYGKKDTRTGSLYDSFVCIQL